MISVLCATVVAWPANAGGGSGEGDRPPNAPLEAAVVLWPGDVPVSTAPKDQGIARGTAPGVAIASDSAGGAYIAWDSNDVGTVFVQHVSASGQPLWAANGLAPAPANWYQFSARLVGDGVGGVIVVWADGRNGICTLTFSAECDVFAQRFNSAGARLWGATGTPVTTAPRNQGTSGIAVASDGVGGAIFAWEDARPPNCCRIFAQRIDREGRPAWTPDGVPVSPPPTIVIGPIGAPPLAASDGEGGAFILWLNQQTNPVTEGAKLAMQRLDPRGQPMWSGIGVTVGSLGRGEFALTPDGTGGAIAVWAAPAADHTTDIYAQRVNAAGEALWRAGGVPVVAAGYFQVTPDVVGDGAGGAIIAWADGRKALLTLSDACSGLTGDCDIFAQRVDATGALRWQADGLPISNASDAQFAPHLVADGSGGAVIAWQDCRGRTDRDACASGADLYGQHVTADGQLVERADGAPVSTAAGNQGVHYGSNLTSSFVMMGDGARGAILAWPDGRNGPCAATIAITECDVFATRIRFVADDPLPILAIDDRAVAEGSAVNAAFRVALSKPSPTPVTARYATADGTATANGDYTVISGLLTFSPGRTSHTVLVPIVSDTLSEGDEDFFVFLSSPSLNSALGDGQATGTISDPPTTRQVPMYRAYSRQSDYHFFTTDAASKNFAVSVLGYQDESNPVPFYVSNVSLPGTVPLFRIYNPNLGRHFYTASAGSRDFLMGIGAVYEKEEGFVYPLATSPVPSGTTELFLLYNNNSGTHLLTADSTQKDGILNLFKGVWVQHTSVGYVFTSPN